LNIYRKDHPAPLEQPTPTLESPVIASTESGLEGRTSSSTVEPEAKNTSQGIEVEKPQTNEGAIPLGTFDSEEAKQLIELKNQTKFVFSGQTDIDEILKKYLGNPVFDEESERRMRKLHVGKKTLTNTFS